jgi:hypothetical protein
MRMLSCPQDKRGTCRHVSRESQGMVCTCTHRTHMPLATDSCASCPPTSTRPTKKALAASSEPPCEEAPHTHFQHPHQYTAAHTARQYIFVSAYARDVRDRHPLHHVGQGNLIARATGARGQTRLTATQSRLSVWKHLQTTKSLRLALAMWWK